LSGLFKALALFLEKLLLQRLLFFDSRIIYGFHALSLAQEEFTLAKVEVEIVMLILLSI
jgi:hypothetical protein